VSDDDGDATHVWRGVSPLFRAGDTDVEPGEAFAPSEATLRSFSDSLEALDPDGDGADDADDADAAPVAVTGAELVADEFDVDPDDYSALRSVGASLDDVDGSASKADLLDALASKASERRGGGS
jgi:hypothetical protein